jgi:Spy/CpxP family protein refolding chaperone
MKQYAKILAAVTLAATLSFAQGPRRQGGGGGTPPDPAQMVTMRVNMLAERLSLTDAQKTQATKIFTDAATASQTVRTSMQDTQSKLSDAIKANSASTIDSLAVTMGQAEGQLTAISAKAEAAFYAILTTEQKANYHPGRGFGGPGGFGRGPGMMGRQGRGQ